MSCTSSTMRVVLLVWRVPSFKLSKGKLCVFVPGLLERLPKCQLARQNTNMTYNFSTLLLKWLFSVMGVPDLSTESKNRA